MGIPSYKQQGTRQVARRGATCAYERRRIKMADNKGPTSIAEEKAILRDRLAKETAEFLSKGNKVQVAPPQTYAQPERFTAVLQGNAPRRVLIKKETT